MKVQQTDPDIKKAIIGGLSYWYRPDTGTELNLPNSISIVYHEQETIGWNNMLEGFYHVGWQTLQQEYYHQIKSRKSGKKWQVGLCKELWDMANDLWRDCNESLHQRDNVVTDLETTGCDQAVRYYFNRLEDPVEEDKYLKQHTLEVLLKKHTNYKREWVREVQKALEKQQECILCHQVQLQAQAVRRRRIQTRKQTHQQEVVAMAHNMTQWLGAGRE